MDGVHLKLRGPAGFNFGCGPGCARTFGKSMNALLSESAMTGAIGGAIAVIVLFFYGKKRSLRVGEGKKMGVNLASDLKCPKCGAAFPTFRIPKNYRQFMWGGWTCKQCGGEFDKWLLPVSKTK